jgi:hypothetical protein
MIAQLGGTTLNQQSDHIMRLQLIDIFRRVGTWDDAAIQCVELTGKSEDATINAILRYQTGLIARRDGDRHTVADATRMVT